jgi:NADPH:quinone reductase-like Zn-dependent oxidoreductase
MRAYVLKHYGGPEGSRLMDVPAPTPGPRDILVKVRAAGLNPVDFKFRQGKLRAILRPKLPFVLGNELAGEVIAVGSDVKRFRVGDRVFARVAKDRALPATFGLQNQTTVKSNVRTPTRGGFLSSAISSVIL